jgi:hypothetical protein
LIFVFEKFGNLNEFLSNLKTGLGGDRDVTEAILNAYRSRAMNSPAFRVICNESYTYDDARVTDQSINGNSGVFIVTMRMTNKSAEQLGGMYSQFCGGPWNYLGSGQSTYVQVKGEFIHFNTGWRLQRFLQ